MELILVVVIVKWPSVPFVNKGKKCSLNQLLIPKQHLIELKQWCVPLPKFSLSLSLTLYMCVCVGGEYGRFERFAMGYLFSRCNTSLST